MKFDPFKIFELSYSYEIKNLDELYYDLFKKNTNLEDLNLAYKILQDPVQKLSFLCNVHGQNQSSSEVMSFIFSVLKDKKNINILCEDFLQEAIQYAILEQWNICWITLQKFIYLKKHSI